MIYISLDPRFDMEQLGFIPSFLSEDDPRPAAEQFNDNYVSGWRPLDGWVLTDPTMMGITYPGDPTLFPFAMTNLRDESILFYRHAQVMILQMDGSFEVCRMD
jgi:hypothetical protein